jgi:hypothetical protein
MPYMTAWPRLLHRPSDEGARGLASSARTAGSDTRHEKLVSQERPASELLYSGCEDEIQ